MSKYHYCILKTKLEKKEFEQKVYETYIQEKNNCLLNYLQVLNEKRMRLKLGETDLIHYLAKKEGKIIAGMSAYINPQKEFICESIGFKITKDKNTCEGVTFFVSKKERMNFFFEILEEQYSLVDYMKDDLKKRGFKQIYGTTNFDHLKIQQKLIGWEVVNINETHYDHVLLKKSLE